MASLRLLAAGASAVGAGVLSSYYLTSDSPVSIMTFNMTIIRCIFYYISIIFNFITWNKSNITVFN